MTRNADYTYLAHRFNRINNIPVGQRDFSDDTWSQFEVFKEEVEELEAAYNLKDREAMKEEITDVMITLFILSDIMDVDIDTAYQRKMEYNLQKSGKRNEDGKVVDDAEVEKPDFSEIDDGFRP